MAGGSETKDLGNGEIDVWNWSGSAWVFKQHITHPDYPSNNSHFGTWLAMDKSVLVPTVLVIGSHDKSGGGKAYIFTRPDINTNFQHVTSFVASDAGSNDQFGIRIAVDEVNGVIAVAATSWDDPVYSNAGKIYLYEKVNGSWPGSVISPATEDASVVLPVGELLGNNYYLGNGLDVRDGHLIACGRGQGYKKINYWLRANKTTWDHQQTLVPAGLVVGLLDIDMDQTANYAIAGIADNHRIVLIKRTGTGSSSWSEIDEVTKPHPSPYEDHRFGQCVKMAPDASSVAVSSAAAWYNNGIGRAWILPIVADALDEDNEKIYEAAAPWRENAQYFGSALGWNGHHLAVGACGDDEAAENAGALYQSLEGDPYPDPDPFYISADATNEYTVRVTYSTNIKSSNKTETNDALNPNNYTITGGFRQLYVTNVTKISDSIYDLTVQEMTHGANYLLEVGPDVENATGDMTMGESAAVDETYDEDDFIGIGELPGLESLEVGDNTLTLFFTEDMLQNEPMGRVSSYVIEPQGDALPIIVEGVTLSVAYKYRAVLSVSGGSEGLYKITVNGVMDLAGNYIDPLRNYLYFRYLGEETGDIERYFFDTNLGAIHLEVETLPRRDMEDMVYRRALNGGYEEQLKLIARALRNAGISRDDTRLKIFKG